MVAAAMRAAAQFIQQQVLRMIDQASNLGQPVSVPWETGDLYGGSVGTGRCNDSGLQHRWYLTLQGQCLCQLQKAYDSLYIGFASGAPFK